MLQKARTDTNATKPSATEKPSTITLEPLLYRGVGALTHGDGVTCGVVGLCLAGVRVDAAVEFALGRGGIAGGGGDGPCGRSPATAVREVIIKYKLYIKQQIPSTNEISNLRARHGDPRVRVHDRNGRDATLERQSALLTCAGAGGGRQVEAAEAGHPHHARHVDGDGGRAGVAESLAEALRLVVHHAAQVGAAGVRRRGGAAVDEGQAREEAEEVGAAGRGAAALAGLLGHRADAGDGNHRQHQQRDAERRSRRRHCCSALAIWCLVGS